jgi:hypothetical protein
MSAVKLTTKTIKGQEVEIFATELGTFHATVGGELVEKPTLQQLTERVQVLLSTKVKPVQISMLESPGWRSSAKERKFVKVTLTGIHSSNGNLLVNTGQQTKQMGHHDSLYVLLTPEQEKEYLNLVDVSEKARKAVEDWEKKYQMTDAKARTLLNMALAPKKDRY